MNVWAAVWSVPHHPLVLVVHRPSCVLPCRGLMRRMERFFRMPSACNMDCLTTLLFEGCAAFLEQCKPWLWHVCVPAC